MKYFISAAVSVLILFISCGKIEEASVRKNIQSLEYTRRFDSRKFASWLNHSNANIRLRAVEALGRIQDPESIILLGNRLKDKNVSVRAAAVFALGQMFNPAAESFILEAPSGEQESVVLAKVAEALGKSGTEKSFSALRNLLTHSSPEVREEAFIASGLLGYRNYPPYPNNELIENALTDNPDALRWRAAYALYRMQSPPSFKILSEKINDPHPLVRLFTIKGLTEMYKLAHSPELKDLLQYPLFKELSDFFNSADFRNLVSRQIADSSWYVRLAAVQLLRQIGSPALENSLRTALDDDHPYVQTEALRAATNFNSATISKQIQNIYENANDWRIKGEALIQLTGKNSRIAFKNIQEQLLTTSWPENYFLIKALEKLASPEAINILKRLASGSHPAQASQAMEAYVNLGGADTDFLLQRLSSGDPAIVTITATYFANKKDTSAVSSLIEAFDQFTAPRDMETIQAIFAALDSVGGNQAVSFLSEQVSHSYGPIRQMAFRALEKRNLDVERPSDVEVFNLKTDFDTDDFKSNLKAEFITSQGNFIIELYPEKAPVNVANFISLIQQDYFDSLYFHRVVPGFVIQGGDPRGDGWGGPGYAIPCEYNDITYHRGTVGMALAGKDTGGSQFFITHTPQPHLNGRYTAFGKVISGIETVDKIMIYDQILDVNLLDN